MAQNLESFKSKQSTGNVTPLRQRQVAAVREAGKISRLAFTDAVKQFIDYVDRDGHKSQVPERAYINMTRSVYSAFRLNKKQKEALEDSLITRDTFDETELVFLQVAERVCAAVIINGMKLGEPRKDIKKEVKRAAKALAATFDSVQLAEVA